jgi:hypothetical protein
VAPVVDPAGKFHAELPVGAPVEVAGQVVRGADAVAEPAARVTLRTVPEAPFSFTTTVDANADGSFSATVPPAAYRLVAMPAPRGDEADTLALCLPSSDAPVEAPAVAPVQVVCLPPARFYGAVRADGETVPDVRVEAVRRADAAVAEPMAVRSRSDDAGLFALSLARGTWDLRLEAPAETKRPVTMVRGLVVDDAPASTVVIELDRTFELYGKVFDESGRPVAASVEAFVVDDAGRSAKVGDGLAGTDGAYTLVLPAKADAETGTR